MQGKSSSYINVKATQKQPINVCKMNVLGVSTIIVLLDTDDSISMLHKINSILMADTVNGILIIV